MDASGDDDGKYPATCQSAGPQWYDRLERGDVL